MLKHMPLRIPTTRIMAVISNVVMTCSAGAAMAQGPSGDPAVRQETIMISLPVFVISMIATAGFTWTVAKYDRKRERDIDELRGQLKVLLHRHKKDEA